MDYTQTDTLARRRTDSAFHGCEQEVHARRDMKLWLAIGCILAVFVIAVVRLHPLNLFGLSEDDSIYFSSAKALASGKGYILPSVPGAPAATKYPVFYPWILSWIWRWNPSFPANLSDAIGVSVAFGMAFVVITFAFLRRLKGIGATEALILTAYCALHPLVVYFSGQIISDIPFAALALAAMFSAEPAARRDAGRVTTIRCGLLAGLSMLLRVFGVPIAAGILAAMIARRAWRQVLIFSGCVTPFFCALAWGAIFSKVATPPAFKGASSSFGWIHTWTYYTSYLAAWKVAVPNTHILGAMLKNNAVTILCQPAFYLLHPYFVRDTLIGRSLLVVVAVATWGGILRHAVRRGWKPVHFVMPAYIAVLLFWNYPLTERFLIPFLPLLAAGIWLETKSVLRLVHAAIFSNQPLSEKVLAVVLGFIIVAFGCAVTFDYAGAMRNLLAKKSRERGDLAMEKQAAYQWLSSTPAESRVIAYEDASVYLYAGRSAIRPITFTTDAFYEQSRLQDLLEHMTDVAHAVHADYWVFTDDDFAAEWSDVEVRGRMQTEKIEHALPIVYRSPYGHVRVRYLGCLQRPETPSCRSADRVLFPSPDDSNFHELAGR